MKISLNKETKLTVLIYFIIFCIQATDIKIGFIKISELILLLLCPFVFLQKNNKYIVYCFFFFSIQLIFSFFITYNTTYSIVSKSFLKTPYMISISRYLELIACLTLCILTYNLIKKNKTISNEIVHRIVKININITKVFVFIYIIVFLKILPIKQSLIVYDNYRLRGLYVEGGPYGLMLSFIFILTYFTDKKKRIYNQLFLVFVILFLAKSKAGLICVLIIITLKNSLYLKQKFKQIIVPFVLISIVSLYFIGKKISYMYVSEMDKIHQSVQERPNDTNLIMGRLSGFYIIPKMILDNPTFGIGLGNYPLARNNKEYRGFFPLPPKEVRDMDASGFGGITDIIIEMGLVGLIMFFSIIYLLMLELYMIRYGIIILSFYIVLFSMGVQLYFLYPWILFSIIIAYKNKYIHEISN